jgi:hypothetical protein
MALTVTPMYKWAWANSEFMVIIMVTGDTSYTSGGYPLAASLFSLNTFASTSDFQLQAPPPNPIFVWGNAANTGAALGGTAGIDAVAGTLRLFLPGGTEVAGAATAVSFKQVLAAFGH